MRYLALLWLNFYSYSLRMEEPLSICISTAQVNITLKILNQFQKLDKWIVFLKSLFLPSVFENLAWISVVTSGHFLSKLSSICYDVTEWH